MAEADDRANGVVSAERSPDDAEQRAIDDGGGAAGLSDDQRVTL